MTTDRLFVIMLVILIPMSGCFGAVDNADAQDDTTENNSETIVHNHYYNNSTTIVDNSTTIVETPVIEKFTSGGMIDYDLDSYYTDNNSNNYRTYTPYTFSTNAGEMVTIHYFRMSGEGDNARISTACDDGTTLSLGSVWSNGEIAAWGSHANCVHTVELETYNLNNNGDKYESGQYTMAWSLVYSIESVTVV
tara:strand:+ start:212 stop:790 length:579 start_codon:yes stop_codon:yes gene_type:complete